MKILKTIFLSALLFSSFAFKIAFQPDFIGTYSISKSYEATLALRINADNTFSYTDLSDPNNKVQIQGKWELKDNIILLKDYSSELPIATKLKVEKDGRAIRYRKGLTFNRLAKH